MVVHKDADSAAKPTETRSSVDTTVNNRAPVVTPANTVTSPTTSPDCQTNAASPACLITPPNIHITHMYVYNFTPEQTERNSSAYDTPIRTAKYQSPAASSGPICRICHDGDGKEDLVSPCRCTGTVGLVHKSCMEKWLSTRINTNDKCEICNYTFATARYPKSVLEWIRSDENNANHRRSLVGDLTCFFLLTPLAIVSSFLCVEGAKRQVMWGNSLEAGCLMALATFLITIYFVWNILTVRYHVRCYTRWRTKNQNVKLLRVQRVSAGAESSSIDSPSIEEASNGLDHPRSQNVAIEITPEENRNGTRFPVFDSV